MDPVTGNSSSAIDYAIAHNKNDPVGTYGPWLAALVGLTLMMGIITAQAARYFSTFGFESRGLFTVVVLCIALVFIAVEADYEAYRTGRFGDFSAYAEVPWQAWTIPIIGQVTVFTAQLFFAHRCYTLYRYKKLVFAGILFGMLSSLALFTAVGVAMGKDPYNSQLGKELMIPAVCINLVTDLAIAGLMLWKLGLGGGKSYSPNTDDVLKRLRNLTVEAAVPPTICAALNMTIYVGSESRRTTIVFATMSGPAFAPNASMGIVDERVEGNEGPELYGRRYRPRDEEDEPTTPTSSHKGLQVDLDRWETLAIWPCIARADS
ncbi:hypothetical protein FS837_010832 [Tulasnella sp. UAMH 9824]|nr:hypothetical protein FS837_010832 [Tulasnella sp. UAMH 9824]